MFCFCVTLAVLTLVYSSDKLLWSVFLYAIGCSVFCGVCSAFFFSSFCCFILWLTLVKAELMISLKCLSLKCLWLLIDIEHQGGMLWSVRSFWFVNFLLFFFFFFNFQTPQHLGRMCRLLVWSAHHSFCLRTLFRWRCRGAGDRMIPQGNGIPVTADSRFSWHDTGVFTSGMQLPVCLFGSHQTDHVTGILVNFYYISNVCILVFCWFVWYPSKYPVGLSCCFDFW